MVAVPRLVDRYNLNCADQRAQKTKRLVGNTPGKLNRRAVARKGRLHFLLRERKLPVASRGYFYMEKLTEQTNPATSVVQKALSHDHENLPLLSDP